jgi:hypothetical protein
MSTLAANNITDAAGTGGPTLANGLTIGTSPLAAPSGSAPSYTCRAWVNFDGTGTPAIREDGNVSSITDHGTGSYTVNFTTAMPDTNYSVVKADNFYSLGDVKTFNTTNVTVQCYQAIGSVVDTSIVCVAIFR